MNVWESYRFTGTNKRRDTCLFQPMSIKIITYVIAPGVHDSHIAPYVSPMTNTVAKSHCGVWFIQVWPLDASISVCCISNNQFKQSVRAKRCHESHNTIAWSRALSLIGSTNENKLSVNFDFKAKCLTSELRTREWLTGVEMWRQCVDCYPI